VTKVGEKIEVSRILRQRLANLSEHSERRQWLRPTNLLTQCNRKKPQSLPILPKESKKPREYQIRHTIVAMGDASNYSHMSHDFPPEVSRAFD